jgi:hypothetical protein
VAIVAELKALSGLGGYLRILSDVLGLPSKSLIESVTMGLPTWDPPPEITGLPPDFETAARVQERVGMSTVQEQALFDQVMKSWRDVRDGEPRQPAVVETRPPPGPKPALLTGKPVTGPAAASGAGLGSAAA